jgi:hypothetical protein
MNQISDVLRKRFQAAQKSEKEEGYVEAVCYADQVLREHATLVCGYPYQGAICGMGVQMHNKLWGETDQHGNPMNGHEFVPMLTIQPSWLTGEDDE